MKMKKLIWLLALLPGTLLAQTIPNPTVSGSLSEETFPRTIGGDIAFGGPNPGVDIRSTGAVSAYPNTPPQIPGITVNISATSSTASISSASTFRNGMGVLLIGAGTAHSMTIPVAPTVTSVVAANSTGTGITAPGPGTGTQYCFKIAVENFTGGTTAASAEACVSGPASLGGQNATIVSMTRVNQTVTVVTSSAHGFTVGCTLCGMVYIQGTLDDAQFSGAFMVDSASDSTHFTFNGGLDTRQGAHSSTTGGTGKAYWWNAIHVVLPTPQVGMRRYVIYEGATGAETVTAYSMPSSPVLVGEPTYMVWDYFGPTMSGNAKFNAWTPTTSPGAATANNLSTTISSGAGTTTLTLANAASTTVTRATILHDDNPALLAAIHKATNTNSATGGGQIIIPALSVVGASAQCFINNSFLDFSASNAVGVLQEGCLVLGDTIKLSNDMWTGAPTQLTCPQFSITCSMGVLVTTANPGFFLTHSSNFSNISFLPTGNAYNTIFADSTANYWIKDSSFVTGGANDYMGVHVYQFSTNAINSFPQWFSNVTFTGGPTQVIGATATPSIISKNFEELTWDGMSVSLRGAFVQPGGSGVSLDYNQRYDSQGIIMPLVSFYNSGSTVGGFMTFHNVNLDTTQFPVVANLVALAAQNTAAAVSIDAVSGGIWPVVSGRPFINLAVSKAAMPNVGQNFNMERNLFGCGIDGAFNTTPYCLYQAIRMENQGLAVGPANVGFAQSLPMAAPTCVTGEVGTVPAGAHTYTIHPVYVDGKEGPSSYACSITQADSVHTVNVSFPAAASTIGYDGYRDGNPIPQTSGSCYLAIPFVTGLTITDPGGTCSGGEPNIGVSGPTSWNVAHVVTPALVLGPIAAPATITGFTQLYMDGGTLWPSFKVGATTYSVAGISGTWTAGYCPKAGSQVGLFTLSASCGGSLSVNGSAAATNLSSTVPAAPTSNPSGATPVNFQGSGSNASGYIQGATPRPRMGAPGVGTVREHWVICRGDGGSNGLGCSPADAINTNNTATSRRSAITGWPNFITATTSTAINNAAGWSDNHNWRTGSFNYMYADFSMSTTTSIRYLFGFTDTSVGTMNQSDTVATSNSISLRYSTNAGDTNWKIVTCGGMACTVTDTGVAANTGNHRLELYEPAVGTWSAWLDGTQVLTAATMNAPSNNTNLFFYTQVTNLAAAVVSTSVGILYMEADH
jgi:hypothetical protein